MFGEQLVRHNTALLAKELGFDEVCYYLYHPTFGILDNSLYHRNTRINIGDKDDKYITLPTQNLLRTWLRRDCKIEICIEPVWKDNNKEEVQYRPWVYYDMEDEKDADKVDEETGYYDNFEDALEDALIEALEYLKSKKP